jgi:prepilin-type N-terminal cleavage/methylation domain-containing protein/prepilin-type processing-associated H-X9-DG protein
MLKWAGGGGLHRIEKYQNYRNDNSLGISLKHLSSLFGFTLVELLVVIAIIGVLIALLLPAVQAAREAARRMTCTNHQKQIVLAYHNYHDSHEALPEGFLGAENGTWAVHILPYIERQTIYDQYKTNSEYFYVLDNRMFLSQVTISVYQCPSNSKGVYSSASTGAKIPLCNYVCCMGRAAIDTPNDASSQKARTSDSEGRGWWDYGTGTTVTKTKAMFMGSDDNKYRRTITFSDITDGLSNTAACSESVHGAVSTNITDRRGYIWWGPTCLFTCYLAPNSKSADIIRYAGTGDLDAVKYPLTSCNVGEPSILAARSFHTGGVNVGYGDGSIRFITDTVNLDAWRNLGAADDGNTLLP